MAKAFDQTIPQTCKWCGNTFYGRKRKFCTHECCMASTSQAAKDKRASAVKTPLPQKTCAICGKTFVPYRANDLYCTRLCYRSSENEKRKERRLTSNKPNSRVMSVTYTCACCGRDYHPRASMYMTYCSRACAYRHRGRNNSNKRRPGSVSDKRRIGVWKRDGFKCQLCGKPMRMRRKPDQSYKIDPMSPTIDHIVPVSVAKKMGWTPDRIHAESNLQSAHWICNIKKNDGVAYDQLRIC